MDPKRRYLLPDGVPRDPTQTKFFHNFLKAQRENFERALRYPNRFELDNGSTIELGTRGTKRIRGQPNPFAGINRALSPVDMTLSVENNVGDRVDGDEFRRHMEKRDIEISADIGLPDDIPGGEVPQSAAWEPPEGSAIHDLFKMVGQIKDSDVRRSWFELTDEERRHYRKQIEESEGDE